MAYLDFDSIPKVDGQPQGCAWGLWGKGDELGTLNYLTPNIIQAAAKEVRKGISVQLDHRLDQFKYLGCKREPFVQKVINFKERLRGSYYECYLHDDHLSFNTQSSSQWDGLRHGGLQDCATHYGGMKHDEIDEDRTGRLGTHRWVERGGIVGRGVLLDYQSWRHETGQPPAPVNTDFGISTEELDAVAAHQGTEIKPGDILLLRTGYTAWHSTASEETLKRSNEKAAFIGVDPSMVSVKWLWNKHFAAVATDTLGFERTPIPFAVPGMVRLHDWLLGHWGMPIGELWNLEQLADVCRKEGRWTFLLTSAPLHVFGGVATPPNVLAIL